MLLLRMHRRDEKGQAASPAGVLYFHIHNPIVEMKGDASEAEIEKKF